jgi:hypothetical protein
MKITDKQKAFLDKVVIGKWSINPTTGLIDVDGLNVSYMNLTTTLVNFGKLTCIFRLL